MTIQSLVRVVVLACLLIISTEVSSSGLYGQQDTMDLRAGVGRIEITPDAPVLMGGYGDRTAPSEGVHDPLFARAVALEYGGKQFVFVSLDLVGLGAPLFERMQRAIFFEFGLKADELVIAWTHTHSGPIPSLARDANPNNLAFTEALIPKVVRAIRAATTSMSPVHTAVAAGHCPIGASRRVIKDDLARTGTRSLGRNPDGPTDKEVLLLKLVRPDGTPVAAIFNFAVHNTSLGAKNLQISGDLFGVAQRLVERILGKNALAPAFVGAAGDIDPWYRVIPGINREPGWTPEFEVLGTLLGEEVVHVYRRANELARGGPIKTGMITIELPGKKGQSLEIAPGQPPVPITLTAALIGGAALVTIPAGLGTELGMKIKTGSPFKNTFVITECNNKVGYIPPDYQYKEGGYEVFSSVVGPEAGNMVVKAALELLKKL